MGWMVAVLVVAAGIGAARPAWGQGTEPAVVLEVRTVDVQTLRLADFDPLHPERAPVLLHVTVVNDARPRDLRVEVRVRSSRYGLLVTGSTRLGPSPPFAVALLTNRDFERYEVEDTGSELVQVALERSVLPADDYIFEVRVFDHSGPGGGVLVADDEGVITTENPGLQLDLLGPGTPFGQEPDVVASAFPLFQWLSDAQRFNFALYEVRPYQRSPEDVVASRPVFSITDSLMAATVLAYPNFAEALQPGRTYAWQVEAVVETAAGRQAQPSEMYWFVVAGGEDLGLDTAGGLLLAASAGETQEVVRLAVSPQEVAVPPGGTMRFQATAYDPEDLPLLEVEPVWSVQPASAGTVDEEGVFTAGASPGVAAVTARVGDVLDYGTVFIEAPTDTTGAVVAADTTVADSTRGVGVQIVFPAEEQAVFEPSVNLVWQVAGGDSTLQRFRVSLWETTAERPVEEAPDAPPLFRQTVQNTTALMYPPGAPLLEPGRPYLVQVEVLDADGNVVAQSAPVRFTMAPQTRAGGELRRVWDDALRQGQLQLTLTLLAELRTPALAPLDRQSLLNAGVQIDLEDGPWVQLSVPVNSLPALVQLPFLRFLTLPAPPWFSGETALRGGASVPAPSPPEAEAGAVQAAAGEARTKAEVGVAVFEFGFDVPRLQALLDARGLAYELHSFRRDRRLDGPSAEAAAHGVATVTALLEHLPPEARLHLFNFETEIEFRAALRFAVDSLGVRVASSSVSWMDAYDHYDGTGYFFGPTLGQILGDKAVLVAAAGNFARSHWEGRFEDPDGDGAHNFTPERNHLTLTLSGDEVYNFLLSWDDWSRREVDLDLWLLDETGQPLYDLAGRPVQSVNRQGPQQYERPTERIRSFAPPYPGTRTYRLQVRAHRLLPDAPLPHFELYVYPWPEDGTPAPEARSSLASGLAVARPLAVVPVGAVDYPHSSQGPTNDGRIRPDFAADGVVRQGEVEALWPVGTSFAAPRVAAAFAQVMARHPDWSAAEALGFLRSYVVGGRNPLKDNRHGWGVVDFERLRAALE